MGRLSRTCLIGGIIITLLCTIVLGVSVQGTEDLKNGPQTLNRGEISTVYSTSVSYSTSEAKVIKSGKIDELPSTATSAVSDSTLPPSQIVQVNDGLNTSKFENRGVAPGASLHSVNKSSTLVPIRSPLEQENASSNLQEESETEGVWTTSPSRPSPSMYSPTTSIVPQWDRNSEDDTTINIGESDRISEIVADQIANTEETILAASSELEYTAKKPDDRSVHGTVAELYAIPKEARDIIALNAQLLGYNTDVDQNSAEWHGPKHNDTALRNNEQENTTFQDAIEITTPPIETTTHRRAYRRRRRRRKGQTSEASRRLQTNEPYQGEDARVETLTNVPSTEAIEHETGTDQPSTRSRYGTRKAKYSARSTTEDYSRERLETTEFPAQDELSSDKVSPGRARAQSYRKRRPRYRAKVRRPNNPALINNEDVNSNNEQSTENNSNPTENTEKSVFQETTESLPSQQETEHFPVTTLRTHIIQAINELQQINTLIASRKDDISNTTKNDALPLPLLLQSRPLIQNPLEANASQYQQSFLRNMNLTEREMAQVFQYLLNSTHSRIPLTAEQLPLQDLHQEPFSETRQNLQHFRSFAKKYEDFSPAASTIDKNVNIHQRNHQPNEYVRNNTQSGTFSLFDEVLLKELTGRDLVTSEQQRNYPRRPANAVTNICQNNTIPEIIDCIRSIEQRKSSGRKGSYNDARTSVPKAAQVNDLRIHRSSRNSTASVGSLRDSRDFLSAQLYSKPTEVDISVKSTAQYSTSSSASNRNRKTISSTPKLGLTNVHSAAGGKPAKNVNSISTSLSGAFKVGGRLLISQLQKLKNVILQIPSQLGRLSADVGNQKQAQKSKSSPVPASLLTPRSSSSLSYIWR